MELKQVNNSSVLQAKSTDENNPVEVRIFGEGHFLRPQLIQFFDCKNVKIEDSPFCCVHHLLRCENCDFA